MCVCFYAIKLEMRDHMATIIRAVVTTHSTLVMCHISRGIKWKEHRHDLEHMHPCARARSLARGRRRLLSLVNWSRVRNQLAASSPHTQLARLLALRYDSLRRARCLSSLVRLKVMRVVHSIVMIPLALQVHTGKERERERETTIMS